jgi:bifunctional non-homologous end joining protein LigD
MAGHEHIVSVDNHHVTVTNLNKVLYPQTGTTKADVLHYYAEIASHMIPHIANRPATRKRWVHGVGTIEDPYKGFYQKNLATGTPEWVLRCTIEGNKHDVEYPLVNDTATLIWLAQIAALEIHVPQWQFRRTGGQQNPDRLVLDLDPGTGVGLIECAEVAQLARKILEDMGLNPLSVTSGSKGIHLYAPLDGRMTSQQASSVAHELAKALEADHKNLIISDMKKSKRAGKVFVDWSQNNSAKTTIAPYSLQGKLHPLVAVPRTWQEIASPSLSQLNCDEVLEHVQKYGDLLKPLLLSRDAGLEPTTQRIKTFTATPHAQDRLAAYRKRRDRPNTPEPVPLQEPHPIPGSSFVIQEHHASRLHYDFRLERDGVLVSWAIPKGLPLTGSENHLAIQTEDHPLEYGVFEGTIPQGEYGAGEVKIWDAGKYHTEKWRNDKEIIVTLTGGAHGGLKGLPRKYALINTGKKRQKNNWLIHLMVNKTIGPFVKPMLATKGSPVHLNNDPAWAFEMKWDGYRAITYIDNTGVRIFSRRGSEVTATFPELIKPLQHAVGTHSVILDGEIVSIGSHGQPDFGLLQARVGLVSFTHGEQVAEGEDTRHIPVHMMLFDLLEIDGQEITGETYDIRRHTLHNIITEDSLVHVPSSFDKNLNAAMVSSRQLHLEGLIAKRKDSTYSPGHRSRKWIKIKHHHVQEVIVAGWNSIRGSNFSAVGSFVLAIPDETGLRYIGHVGTGFTDKERKALPSILKKIAQEKSPLHDVPEQFTSSTKWLRPELVGEVTFLNWTSDGILRHPSWRGWRSDKTPQDVQPE